MTAARTSTWPCSCSTRSTCSRSRPTGWPRPGVVATAPCGRHGHDGARRRAAATRTCPVLQALRGHAPRRLRVRRTPTRPAACSTPALLEAGAVVQVGPEGLGVTATARDGDLPARLLAAVAAHVAEHGVARLGSCAQRPVPLRVRRPHPRRHPTLLLHALQRPGGGPGATAGARGPARPDREPGVATPPAPASASSRRALPPAPRPRRPRWSPRVLLAHADPGHRRAAAATEPVLGSPGHLAPAGKGWGKAHPRHVFNGGDPSGEVAKLEWRHWGGPPPRARGVTWLLRPEGGYYAAARPDRAPRRGARHLPRRHRGVHPAGVPRRPPPRRPGRQALAPSGRRRRHLLTGFEDAAR